MLPAFVSLVALHAGPHFQGTKISECTKARRGQFTRWSRVSD
jgi:hypothetical protein